MSGHGGARAGSGRKWKPAEPQFAKACASCGVVKPSEAFSPYRKARDGRASWCRDCANEATREWRRRNPAAREATKQIQRGDDGKPFVDPVAFSVAVCEHVATYVERAIARFERRTGMEAPPHLTAIRSVARQLAEEQEPSPDRPGVVLECAGCGREIAGRRRDQRWCSDRCARHARFLADKASGKHAADGAAYRTRRRERQG